MEYRQLGSSGEEMVRLEKAGRPPLLYPFWHQRKTASGRLGPADRSLLAPYLGN